MARPTTKPFGVLLKAFLFGSPHSRMKWQSYGLERLRHTCCKRLDGAQFVRWLMVTFQKGVICGLYSHRGQREKEACRLRYSERLSQEQNCAAGNRCPRSFGVAQRGSCWPRKRLWAMKMKLSLVCENSG